MRLKTSRVSAEEIILRLLNRGYQLAPEIYGDHIWKRNAGAFDKKKDLSEYHEMLRGQYIGPIAEAVIHDLHSKTTTRRAQGANANYLVIDGQDTARLLYGYDKLPK